MYVYTRTSMHKSLLSAASCLGYITGLVSVYKLAHHQYIHTWYVHSKFSTGSKTAFNSTNLPYIVLYNVIPARVLLYTAVDSHYCTCGEFDSKANKWLNVCLFLEEIFADHRPLIMYLCVIQCICLYIACTVMLQVHMYIYYLCSDPACAHSGSR